MYLCICVSHSMCICDYVWVCVCVWRVLQCVCDSCVCNCGVCARMYLYMSALCAYLCVFWCMCVSSAYVWCKFCVSVGGVGLLCELWCVCLQGMCVCGCVWGVCVLCVHVWCTCMRVQCVSVEGKGCASLRIWALE